ncbi:hypothetical protein [Dapis sp. BLCC M229]|uniref:hypothetical protein n=1 Tax=Dapis sp. BLCC M229 TaxID=3400188 RepID=UPI003CFA9149
MENNKILVEEIEQKAQIKDVKNLSPKETEKVVELLDEGKLEQKHIEALTTSSPNFINSIVDLVGTLPRLAEKATEINKQALDKINHINQTTNTLSILASNVKSDEAKVKIAELIVQVAKEYNETIKAINTNNNNALQNIINAVGGVIIFAVAIIFKPDEN